MTSTGKRFDRSFEREMEKIAVFGLGGGGARPGDVQSIKVDREGRSFTIVFVMNDGSRRKIKNAQNLVSGSMKA